MFRMFLISYFDRTKSNKGKKTEGNSFTTFYRICLYLLPGQCYHDRSDPTHRLHLLHFI